MGAFSVRISALILPNLIIILLRYRLPIDLFYATARRIMLLLFNLWCFFLSYNILSSKLLSYEWKHIAQPSGRLRQYGREKHYFLPILARSACPSVFPRTDISISISPSWNKINILTFPEVKFLKIPVPQN